MPIIQIRELEQLENQLKDSFDLNLSIDGTDYGRVTAIAPFMDQPQKEADLAWYLEEWMQMPIIDTQRSQGAAASVREYGESLFAQIFRNNQAYAAYDRVKDRLDLLQIEIIGHSMAFQAWHWEALCDPQLPRPFAVDCAIARRHTQAPAIASEVKPSAMVNVLLVIARPDEESDVGYRTIARPVIEVILDAQLRVNVEILRPATYEALVKKLTERGAGYYHILHFDGHGSLMTSADLKAGAKRNRYTYQRGYGLGNLQDYEGLRAFLFFDGESKGQAMPVEASELAKLLTGQQIPVCILNACQSAKQVDDPLQDRETSLGSQLMASGMQAVVAMGYTVTVSAAKILMEKLYAELFAGKDFMQAVRLGRYELYNNKQRAACLGMQIELEDWILPVLYLRKSLKFDFCGFSSPEAEEAYWQRQGSLYRFPSPEYGFVGRDLDILKIEKALLRHNLLLLRGMGGTGKTTLLNYLREWWQTTNFAEDVFYFGYDQKAWTIAQIMFEISQRIYNKYEHSQFTAMNLVAQLSKLVKMLKSSNYVLILDNLESVTGQQLAIQNTLDAPEQQNLHNFLRQLIDGKTKVVLGSRSGEEWLNDTFRKNIYGLQGLDGEARSQLAEKILTGWLSRVQAQAMQTDADFQRLMKLLAGYPLAMEVVLANLKQRSPLEILQALQGADIDLDRGDGGDKTSNILKCVEYSHSNLSESAQKLLLCLAPFNGFIDRDDMPNYAEELKKLPPFADYDFANFDRAIQEAIDWGLLSPLQFNPDDLPPKRGEEQLLTIQPVFPYFLQTKLNAADSATRKALRQGFKTHYQSLASSYYNLMESKQAQEKQMGIFFCRWEYENLYAALQITLANQESIRIYFCLDKYFEVISDIQSGLKLAEEIDLALAKYPREFVQGEFGQEVTMALDYLASAYLETKQYEQAKRSYEKKLKILDLLTTLNPSQKGSSQASTYHQLGIVAQELRSWDEAKNYCLQALEICVEFSDRYKQASIYHNLGMVAQMLRSWDEAKNYYLQALSIFVEFSDRYSQAATYHELGRMAQKLRSWDEAKNYYLQALEICVEFSDRYSQSSTYGQLGNMAKELRSWDEAKNYYLQALEICVEFSDRYSQASTYHNLGSVAEDLEEFPEAKNYFWQALEIWREFNDEYSIQTFSIPAFAHLYQATQDQTIVAELAKALDTTMETIQQLLR